MRKDNENSKRTIQIISIINIDSRSIDYSIVKNAENHSNQCQTWNIISIHFIQTIRTNVNAIDVESISNRYIIWENIDDQLIRQIDINAIVAIRLANIDRLSFDIFENVPNKE